MNEKRYLAVCWGCYECGDETRLLGRFPTSEEAQAAVAGEDMGRSWSGDRSVIDLTALGFVDPPSGPQWTKEET